MPFMVKTGAAKLLFWFGPEPCYFFSLDEAYYHWATGLDRNKQRIASCQHTIPKRKASFAATVSSFVLVSSSFFLAVLSLFSLSLFECDLRPCIHALGSLFLLICVPNGGAQQLKTKRVSKTAEKAIEAKLRIGQGYKLLAIVAGLSSMLALAA